MKHTMHAVAAGLMLMLSGCGSDNDENTQVIAIDVLAANIEGQFSLNGGDFPVSQYEHGIITMADTDGNPAMLSETYNGEYAVMLVQGDYTDHYSVVQSGGNVPVNKGETISGNHSVQIDQVHDVEVTAPSVRFQFTLNNMPFPATEYDDGNFYLQSQTGGEAFLLGNSHSSIDPVQVMPGTYDVIYELESGGDQVPVNQHATVDTIVIDEMTSGVTVDITTVDFRLSATLDGSPFPVSQYEHGIFRLVNSSGDIVELGESYNLPLAVKVIEGSYDITYSHVDGLALPVNDEAIILANVDISVNSAPIIDILSAEVTPSYSLNGGGFPISEYQDAEIFLRGFTGNDVMSLGNSHDANPAAVRVVQGEYDIIYRHETGDQVPLNKNAVVATGIVINVDQALPVEVNSIAITGTFTHNGSGFPASQYEAAEFLMRGANTDDEFLLGYSYDGNGTVDIIPGTYDVIYKHVDGANIPQNTQANIMDNVLLDNTQSIRINVESRSIVPTFTLNGNAFPESIYQHAEFYLHGNSEADRIFFGRSYLDNNSLLVIPGDYDVMYEHNQGSNVPVNSRTRVNTIDIL